MMLDTLNLPKRDMRSPIRTVNNIKEQVKTESEAEHQGSKYLRRPPNRDIPQLNLRGTFLSSAERVVQPCKAGKCVKSTASKRIRCWVFVAASWINVDTRLFIGERSKPRRSTRCSQMYRDGRRVHDFAQASEI
jgi:hypothetical protein